MKTSFRLGSTKPGYHNSGVPRRSREPPRTVDCSDFGQQDIPAVRTKARIVRIPAPLSARSWDEDVVAGSAVEQVHAPIPLQHVVAGAANESVVGRTADQEVVAVAAVRRELDGASRPA